MPVYKATNWDKFQHYKDRVPPWIRLHRVLLDDYEYHCLPDASKALAPLLWLLASEHPDPACGEIHATDEKIAFRLRMTVKKFQESVKPLIDSGFFEVLHDASTMLAERVRDATSETETEIDRDTVVRGRVTLDDLSVDHIADWLARKRAEGKYIHHDERFILDYFKNYCRSKGKRYADYIAGYRNAFEWDRLQPKPNGASNWHHGQPTKQDRLRATARQTIIDLGLAPD